MANPFQAGRSAGIAEERRRLREIMTLPEAELAPELAANLALASDLDVEAVRTILARSIQIRSAREPQTPAAQSRNRKAERK